MNRLIKAFLPLLLILILLFSVFYVKIRIPHISPENTLLKSFQASDARFVNSELYLHGRLNDRTDTLEEIRRLVGDIEQHLGMARNEAYSMETTENDSMKKVELKGTAAGGMLVNVAMLLDTGGNQTADNRFSIRIGCDVPAELGATRETLSGICREYRLEPKASTCYTGSWDGRLDTGRLNELCRRMFEETEAIKVEGMRDHNLISVSAYSPMIGESIRVKGKRINMGLAIRYNAYEDKTYLWLATPVIMTEY